MYDLTQCVHHPNVSIEGYQSLGIATYRASTIVFDDMQSYVERHKRGREGYSYGLYGTPTSRTLEAQISALHNGLATSLFPSGQAAIAGIMLATLRPGDNVLVPASAYPPVLAFCQKALAPLGITHTIYDPLLGCEIERRIDEKTRLIWVESPGSTTLEVQDLPAISSVARRHGILVGCDNTWASPLLCKPLQLGADFVVEALTKYAAGHSDVLLGSVTIATQEHGDLIYSWLKTMGIGVSPDDCGLVLRGLETMGIRLAHVGKIACEIADRLRHSAAIRRVLHPALPDHPGHLAFQRDFSGTSGLFSIELSADAVPFLPNALNGLKYFALGASWGGTRSLIAPIKLTSDLNGENPSIERTYLRVSIGLEDPDDLWEDLNEIFYILEQRALEVASV